MHIHIKSTSHAQLNGFRIVQQTTCPIYRFSLFAPEKIKYNFQLDICCCRCWVGCLSIKAKIFFCLIFIETLCIVYCYIEATKRRLCMFSCDDTDNILWRSTIILGRIIYPPPSPAPFITKMQMNNISRWILCVYIWGVKCTFYLYLHIRDTCSLQNNTTKFIIYIHII